MLSSEVQSAFAERLPKWKASPALMVRELFGVEPDPWQVGVLERFPTSQRQAMQACKGPGKTALLSWLAWNFLLTRPFPKIAATSVTGDNLSDNLWAEMAKWQRVAPLLGELFSWTKTRISSKQYPETWFMSADRPRTRCNYKNGELEGLHETWRPDGSLLLTRNYKDGKLEGLYERWYRNGNLEEKSNYKDGLHDGESIDWGYNGLARISIYREGKRVSSMISPDLGFAWLQQSGKETVEELERRKRSMLSRRIQREQTEH